MGLPHADGLNLPALVLDLIEPARGTVEELVLQTSTERAFRKADFAEPASASTARCTTNPPEVQETSTSSPDGEGSKLRRSPCPGDTSYIHPSGSRCTV